jgi:isopentenyl-diphosphate delta-isomerase
MEERKKDHISLAFKTQTPPLEKDDRFRYEPMLSGHPSGELPPVPFGKKEMRLPVWISSMTGGTKLAGKINHNLARLAAEFGLGMGLGSCSIILKKESALPDFDLRSVIGDERPFYANMGIAQIEYFLEKDDIKTVIDLASLLKVDGLVVHVNPIQEWLQPEGDKIKTPPVDTLREFLKHFDREVIVKEVGQGMGKESLKALMEFPLTALEFGAFGGTNFSKVELQRREDEKTDLHDPFTYVGHTAEEMVHTMNSILEEKKTNKIENLIVSGGVKNFLDGYYLINKSRLPAIYGMASTFLKYAKEDYVQLKNFMQTQEEGLKMAQAFLKVI